MKTRFKKIEQNSNQVHQLNFPETFFERLIGIKKYSWTSDRFSIVFKSPCILHSFGVKKEMSLKIMNCDSNQISDPIHFPKSSLAICLMRRAWILESYWHQSSPTKTETERCATCPTSQNCSDIKIINCQRFYRILKWIFAFASLAMMTSVCLADSTSRSVKIQVGESKEVSLAEAPRSLDLSQPDVIDVQRIGSSNKILITGLKSGFSLLTVRFHDGQQKNWNFQVGQPLNLPNTLASLSSASLLRTAREIQKKSGLEVTVDNGRIALFGILQNETQVKAVLETCLDRDECLPRFSLTDSTGKYLATQLESHFAQLDGCDIRVVIHLGGIILKGTVNNDELAQRISRLAQSVAPRVSQQLVVTPSASMIVESQLSFYRISQTGLTALGVSTTADSRQQLGNLIQIQTEPQAARLRAGPNLNFSFPEILIKAFSQKGVIKQIAQPSILIASGGRGELLSGGELLFRSQGQVQKFFSQNYGISAILQPRVVNGEKIVQKVELKITHPQIDPTQNALSSMSSSVLNTEISSKPGEQLLLTRINQKANGKSVNKIPIVGHLPIIGELFKSRDLSEDNAELWITLKSDIAQSKMAQSLDFNEVEKDETKANWLD